MGENKLSNKQFVFVAIVIIICGIAIMGRDYFFEKKNRAYEDMSILLSQQPEETYASQNDPDTSIVIPTRDSNDGNGDPSGKVKKVSRTYNYIGRLKIPDIKLNRGFVSLKDSNNNVNYNVAIIKGSDYPNVSSSNFILAAHSGSGWNAFFTNIDKLKKGSIAYVTYKGREYSYKLTQIYSDKKSDNGIIVRRNNDNKKLVLVTCKRPDYKKYYLVLIFDLIDEKLK